MQLRCVFVESKMYQVWRYESDGEKCVIRGPVPKQISLGDLRKFDDKKSFSFASSNMNAALGTPVELLGLKKAAHRNGENGDVRDYCQSTDRV